MNEEEKKNEPVVYRGDQITSPINKSNPKQGDPCHTLADDDRNYVVYKNHRQDARFKPVGETCIAVSQLWGTGGNNQPMVVDGFNTQASEDVSPTLMCQRQDTKNIPMVLEGNGSRSSHHGDGFSESETMYTLNTVEVHAVVDPKTYQETSGTLSGGAHASGFNGQDANNDMLVSHPVVRRLTPLEAERLQGFPDGWTNIGDWKDTQGKKHKASDAPRYRALGNSLALPFWQWLAGRIVGELKKDDVEDPTMASLFDGIGGFPLVFQRQGCKPVWASEIEEFPIAVTKIHFPEEEEDDD